MILHAGALIAATAIGATVASGAWYYAGDEWSREAQRLPSATATRVVAPVSPAAIPTVSAAVFGSPTRPPTATPTRRPQPKVTPQPPRPACHPSYQGACLPVGRDVDCGEISATNIRVVGYDEYRLDRDGDGWGCEG